MTVLNAFQIVPPRGPDVPTPRAKQSRHGKVLNTCGQWQAPLAPRGADPGPHVHILTKGMFPTVLAPRRQSFTIESRESSQQSSLKRWKLKKGGI